MVKYREWYGSTGEPNVGLRLTAEEVADGIKQREAGEAIAYGVADPAIFSSDGGPSIAERMFGRGVIWRRADKRAGQQARRAGRLGRLSAAAQGRGWQAHGVLDGDVPGRDPHHPGDAA